jgi:hypothetical protein
MGCWPEAIEDHDRLGKTQEAEWWWNSKTTSAQGSENAFWIRRRAFNVVGKVVVDVSNVRRNTYEGRMTKSLDIRESAYRNIRRKGIPFDSLMISGWY